jgi:hypothetical protein
MQTHLENEEDWEMRCSIVSFFRFVLISDTEESLLVFFELCGPKILLLAAVCISEFFFHFSFFSNLCFVMNEHLARGSHPFGSFGGISNTRRVAEMDSQQPQQNRTVM